MPGGKRGGVKFLLLHDDRCPRDGFHFRVGADGSVERLLDERERGQHPGSIGICIAGDLDASSPGDAQLDALKGLLLELKIRYPAARVGAHRQVRGDEDTTCPGRRLPMREIAEWAATRLIELRDEQLTRDVESQYSPL